MRPHFYPNARTSDQQDDSLSTSLHGGQDRWGSARPFTIVLKMAWETLGSQYHPFYACTKSIEHNSRLMRSYRCAFLRRLPAFDDRPALRIPDGNAKCRQGAQEMGQRRWRGREQGEKKTKSKSMIKLAEKECLTEEEQAPRIKRKGRDGQPANPMRMKELKRKKRHNQNAKTQN